MARTKEQWLAEMGGFRFGESVELTMKRRRILELANEIKSGTIDDEQRIEFVKLIESIPDALE